MSFRWLTGLEALIALVCAWPPAHAASAGEGRHLTIDDVLRMEDIGRVSITADERRLVFEHIPPYEQAPNLETLYLQSDRSALAKIVSVDIDEPGKPELLFPQDADGGYWVGGFSSDGHKVAVYSLLRGQVRAGVFDFRTRQVRFFSSFTPNYYWLVQSALWISADEILYPALPEGEMPAIVFKPGLVARLNTLWRKAFEGKEPSTTVQVSTPSGIAAASDFRAGELVRVNVRTGEAVPLGEGYYYNLRLSPDGRYVAALREGGLVQPALDKPPDFDARRRELVVFGLAKGTSKMRIPCPECDVVTGSLQWSASSGTLAFFARLVGQSPETGEFRLYTPDNQELRLLQTRGIRLACDIYGRELPQPAAVLDQGVGIFADAAMQLDAPLHLVDDCAAGTRRDLYVVRPSGISDNLTATFKSVDSNNPAAVTRGAVLVIADGALWRLGADGTRRRITRQDATLTVWAPGLFSGAPSEEQTYTGYPFATPRIILKTKSDVLTVDVASGEVRTLPMPMENAQLLSVSAAGRTAVFKVDRPDGSRVSVVRGFRAPVPVLALNSHLRGVRQGSQVSIQYRVRDTPLTSCALLPPDWKSGVRLPTIVNVYPGMSGRCRYTSIENFNPYNPQLMAAHGYVVLFPNTQRSMLGTADSPTGALTEMVLAAADAAVAAGYADPERLGIYGMSQGNHSALQVITETTRFKAAVAINGISDFASHYGTMPLYGRHVPDSLGAIGNAGRYEAPLSLNYLGAKPWEDPQRYVRNSPVFHADRVHTPLLLFHSDFDQFPLGQSEEMFSALYRLRRESTYVTYWGEGHGNLSPANIRDSWRRMFDWYDRHLLAGSTAWPEQDSN